MCIEVRGQLTVFFDCPFWVGIFEVFYNNTLQTYRVVFGPSEPKDYEVYQLVSEYYFAFIFNAPTKIDASARPKAVNPKRLQRQINKQIQSQGVSNKSFEAMRISYETHKLAKKKQSKQNKDQMKDAKFKQKQQKKHEKRRGH